MRSKCGCSWGWVGFAREPNRRKMRVQEGERCVVPVLCELKNQVVVVMVRMAAVG